MTFIQNLSQRFHNVIPQNNLNRFSTFTFISKITPTTASNWLWPHVRSVKWFYRLFLAYPHRLGARCFRLPPRAPLIRVKISSLGGRVVARRPRLKVFLPFWIYRFRKNTVNQACRYRSEFRRAVFVMCNTLGHWIDGQLQVCVPGLCLSHGDVLCVCDDCNRAILGSLPTLLPRSQCGSAILVRNVPITTRQVCCMPEYPSARTATSDGIWATPIRADYTDLCPSVNLFLCLDDRRFGKVRSNAPVLNHSSCGALRCFRCFFGLLLNSLWILE